MSDSPFTRTGGLAASYESEITETREGSLFPLGGNHLLDLLTGRLEGLLVEYLSTVKVACDY